ncbi:MAG: hypothetical protein WA070_17580 [Sphingobium sp.]
MASAAPTTTSPIALRGLETGEWELHERGAESRKLCVSDLRQLLQVRHGRTLCRSMTVDDSHQSITVNYDCAAAGNGRTQLRVETARLVQINSQGVANGAPFAFSVEGRRVGACH